MAIPFYQSVGVMLGENNANNAANTSSVVRNDDGSILERLESIMQDLRGTGGIASFPAAADPANAVSIAEVLHSIWAAQQGAGGITTFPAAAAPGNAVSLAEVIRAIYNLVVPTTATGTTDIDVSAADYTAGAGVPILTITPAAGAPIADLIIDLDLNKAVTGLLIVNTSETVQLVVESKIDGTNWRSLSKSWPAASSTTGLGVPDAADDLDADDDSPGIRWHLGPVGVSQAIRINVLLSAETGGDAEIPYAVHYRAMAAPTITDVAAG